MGKCQRENGPCLVSDSTPMKPRSTDCDEHVQQVSRYRCMRKRSRIVIKILTSHICRRHLPWDSKTRRWSHRREGCA
ncbi:hypothetical protein BDZ97DRAFT_1799135 [Flammula alnicola]|nr:hypothetical protein BDZ97DRAFT_1799135 [Flammula alnicola]